MQSFDINLLAQALAPSSSTVTDGTGDDFFADAFERELARLDAENAARDATDQDQHFQDSNRDSYEDTATPYEDPDESYTFPDYSSASSNNEPRADERNDGLQTDARGDATDNSPINGDGQQNAGADNQAAEPVAASNPSDVDNGTTTSPAKGGDETPQNSAALIAKAGSAVGLPIVSAGVTHAASIVQQVTPVAVEPAVVALAAASTNAPAVAPPVAQGAATSPIPTAATTPPSSISSQLPTSPVQPIPQPGDGGLGTDTSAGGNGSGNLGKNLATPMSLPIDDGEPIIQSIVQPFGRPTVGQVASTDTNNTPGSASSNNGQPAGQAKPAADIATRVAPTATQAAPEPASMAQTMIAAQLARSGSEGMAANSGAATTDVIPPVTGVASVSQPGSAAAVTQTAALHRPSAHPAPADQVAVQIQHAVASGETRISVRLHPAELGRVDVDLEIGKDGRVLAMVTAEKPETLEMLQRDTRVLERALQDAGLDTDSDSLNFNLFGEREAGDTPNQTNAANRHDGNHDGLSGAEDEESTTRQFVSDRVLDIKV